MEEMIEKVIEVYKAKVSDDFKELKEIKRTLRFGTGPFADYVEDDQDTGTFEVKGKRYFWLTEKGFYESIWYIAEEAAIREPEAFVEFGYEVEGDPLAWSEAYCSEEEERRIRELAEQGKFKEIVEMDCYKQPAWKEFMNMMVNEIEPESWYDVKGVKVYGFVDDICLFELLEDIDAVEMYLRGIRG